MNVTVRFNKQGALWEREGTNSNSQIHIKLSLLHFVHTLAMASRDLDNRKKLAVAKLELYAKALEDLRYAKADQYGA